MDYKLDITKNEVEFYYDEKADDLSSCWEDFREKLIDAIRLQLKGCRKQKIKIGYHQVYSLIEPHLYLVAFKYFAQGQHKLFMKNKIQKKFYIPEFLMNDLFMRVFPIRHILFWNKKLKLQYLIGFILLCVSVYCKNNLGVLFNLGFILSFYGALSITILTTMSDEQILYEMVQPVWNEKVYIYKNLKGNQRSNFAGVLFLLVGFIIQLLVIFLQNR